MEKIKGDVPPSQFSSWVEFYDMLTKEHSDLLNSNREIACVDKNSRTQTIYSISEIKDKALAELMASRFTVSQLCELRSKIYQSIGYPADGYNLDPFFKTAIK
jgi:hypothetical protein